MHIEIDEYFVRTVLCKALFPLCILHVDLFVWLIVCAFVRSFVFFSFLELMLSTHGSFGIIRRRKIFKMPLR